MTGIGHLSSAFILKCKFKETPLWILLVAAEIVEMVWVFLNLNPFGFSPALEYMKIEIPFLYIGNMKLLSQQYSHSLVGGMIIGILYFFILKTSKITSALRYIAIAIPVSGHWFLDYLVHDHDLQIFPISDTIKVGPLYSFNFSDPNLGISATVPMLGFGIQAFFSTVCAYYFLKNFQFSEVTRKRNFIIGFVILNLLSLPIFIKGLMTFLIRSEVWMAITVLSDMIFAGIVLLYLSKDATPIAPTNS
ncbi:hypothetical protein LEP1GSC050_2626 [Leptospira broomii serovar Hurstbridge str. 5399]|uniref:Uncharacterized protein n=1 Tax=Leptospira broomii serovar Hurstbridge str. 5399 TaxID=1049789 RepID=T0GKF5_9LEPT|nr:hypothetical protein [Leptospira broomii]EQA45868.1 hypothetical protein LEP1GSC050_2626 [Leptospira broomii serovar Hurstbridge str. 5399]